MPCSTPYYVDIKGRLDDVPVPCGKCPDCKRRRTHQWVFRLLQEDRVSCSAYFVTLTYDTDNVPISRNGFMTLVSTVPSVNKKGKPVRLPHKLSFQAFMKRLRKAHPKGSPKLRYYAVGEYGDKRKRPHYHAILFNCDKSLIEKCWTFGGVHIGDVNGKSIGYTAKYINKARRIPEFKSDDRMKEFSLMSKGLGKSYLTPSISRFYKDDYSRSFVMLDGGYKVALPRYYADKLFTEDEKPQRLSVLLRSISDDDAISRENYYRSNPDGDYDLYLESRRIARYKSFYHFTNQKRLL